jgi:hypothetical protein
LAGVGENQLSLGNVRKYTKKPMVWQILAVLKAVPGSGAGIKAIASLLSQTFAALVHDTNKQEVFSGKGSGSGQ